MSTDRWIAYIIGFAFYMLCMYLIGRNFGIVAVLYAAGVCIGTAIFVSAINK